MSALPPTADITLRQCDVRKVPSLTEVTSLLDHLVGATKERQRHGDAKHLCGFEVDEQFDFGGLLDRQVHRLFALENAAHVAPGETAGVDDVGAVADQASSRDKLAAPRQSTVAQLQH